MKRYLITGLLLIMASTSALSQVIVRPGAKAGLNASTITNNEDSSRKLGFNGGMFVNISFSRFYELQAEATYSNQGSSWDSYEYYDPYLDAYIYEEYDDMDLHYLTLGVANKFFVSPDTGFHFIAGPSLDILIDNGNNRGMSPVDLSFFGGIGYEFPTGLGIELRYKQGIIDIRDDYYDYDDYYDNMMLNSVLQAGLFYKFNF